MSKLLKRLDAHFVAVAAAGVAGVGATQSADAAIVHSGIVNINVPSTTSGIYLNVVTGVSATTPAGSVGWDLNPWSSSGLSVWTNNGANPAASDGTVINAAGGSSATLTDNLPAGFIIDGTSTYGRTAGSEVSGPTALLVNSSNNIVGFRFWNEAGSSIHFGWVRFSTGTTLGAQPRAVVEYAYESTPNTGIAAGAIPTPGSLALLAVGALGLAGRRRR